MIVLRQKQFGLLGTLFNSGMDYIDWIEQVENLEKTYPFQIYEGFQERSLVEGGALRKATGDNDKYSYDDLTAYVFDKLGKLSKNQSQVVMDNFKNLPKYVENYINGKGIGSLKDYALYVVFLESKSNMKNIDLVFSFIGLRGPKKGQVFDYTVRLK